MTAKTRLWTSIGRSKILCCSKENFDLVLDSSGATWREAVKCLETVKYYNENQEILIRPNWSLHERRYKDQRRKKLKNIPIDVQFQIDSKYVKQVGSKILAEGYLEEFLDQSFLAFNLSSPGAFDLYLSPVLRHPKGDSYKLDLCSNHFEAAWDSSLKQGFSFIEKIPFETTWNWLQSLSFSFKQIATSRTERALFALLHISSYSDVSPAELIWITHALEALYDTPIALTGKYVYQRAVSVLNVQENKKKYIKDKLSALYQLRSSFVHGSLKTARPSSSGTDAEPYIYNLIDMVDFGVGIIVATLQKLITNGWKEFEFTESYRGI